MSKIVSIPSQVPLHIIKEAIQQFIFEAKSNVLHKEDGFTVIALTNPDSLKDGKLPEWPHEPDHAASGWFKYVDQNWKKYKDKDYKFIIIKDKNVPKDSPLKTVIIMGQCVLNMWGGDATNKRINLVDTKKYLKTLPPDLYGKIIKVFTVNTINGDFDCTGISGSSLIGCPKEVIGDFGVRLNPSIKNLVYGPIKVTRDFDCGGNHKLVSLEGAPKEVGGNFRVSYVKITTLVGCPEKIIGNFDCRNCDYLESLEGCPKEVGGNFYCYRHTKSIFTEEQIRAVCNVTGHVFVRPTYGIGFPH